MHGFVKRLSRVNYGSNFCISYHLTLTMTSPPLGWLFPFRVGTVIFWVANFVSNYTGAVLINGDGRRSLYRVVSWVIVVRLRCCGVTSVVPPFPRGWRSVAPPFPRGWGCTGSWRFVLFREEKNVWYRFGSGRGIAQAQSHLDRRRNEGITKEGGQKGEGLWNLQQSSRQLEAEKRAVLA